MATEATKIIAKVLEENGLDANPYVISQLAEIKQSSPRLSQLDSAFIERGTLSIKRLRRSPRISLYAWGTGFPEKPEPKPFPKQRPDGMKLARHYQALLDSGKFESRAALARHLGVSRARVSQVLGRIQ